MNLLDIITEVSRDLDPTAPGYQAHVSYVLLNVFFPLAVGVTVALSLRAIERLFGVGVHGGEH